jgi:hypothetical protein
MLATHAGYPPDMDHLDTKKMLEAMIASFDGDEMQLRDLIAELIAWTQEVRSAKPIGVTFAAARQR